MSKCYSHSRQARNHKRVKRTQKRNHHKSRARRAGGHRAGVYVPPQKPMLQALEKMIQQSTCEQERKLMAHFAKSHLGWVMTEHAALKRIARFLASAIRPHESLSFKSKSNIGKVRELATHLFARYEVPVCLENAFLRHDDKSAELYIALGRGFGLRALLPDELSKKEAHHFLHAPRGCGAEAAIRYAQARVAGMNENDARVAMRLCASSQKCMRLLFQKLERYKLNDELDLVLRYCVSQIENDANLLHDWPAREELISAARKAYDVGVFKKSGLKVLRIAGVQFVELSSAWRLRVEGQKMRHCIFSYRQQAKQGKSFIFSMRQLGDDNDASERLLTIEIDARERSIVQVRGYRNRRATPEESKLLAAFAKANGLEYFVSALD